MKIIALPNPDILAHVSRLLEIGRELRRRGHEVVFAGEGDSLPIVHEEGFDVLSIPYLSGMDTMKAGQSGRLWDLYPGDRMRTIIEAELALYRQTRPDIVMFDNRVTVSTSAELAGIKTVSVFNAHYSLLRKFPFNAALRPPVPHWAATGWNHMVRTAEFALWDHLVMKGLRQQRKDWGLPPRYSHGHEEGDLNLIPDDPLFNPVHRLPPRTFFIGPLPWINKYPDPACLDRLDPDRPVVYVSIGSHGKKTIFSHLNALAEAGIQVVTSVGSSVETIPSSSHPDIHVEKFVNAERLLPRCAAVVCHGGNGTLYQAFLHGLPVVGLPTHEEQAYNVRRAVDCGFGVRIRDAALERGGPSELVQAVQRVIRDPLVRQKVKSFQNILKGWNGAFTAAERIESFTSDPRGMDRERKMPLRETTPS